MTGNEATRRARPRPAAARPWLPALVRAGAVGLVLLGLLEATLRIIGHDDLWWNLATGRWIAEHFRVPTADPFSHTFAGQPWVNPEWLSHVLFYLVYRHLGENWIVYLRGSLIALVFGVAYLMTRGRSGSRLISLIVTAFGLWVCQPFLDARPQLWTFLCALLLLWILDRYRRGGRDLLLLAPVLLLAWTQLHGGYILGLLILVGNLGAETLKRITGLPAVPLAWRQIRKLAAVTAISSAAVAINPWGVEAYTHPLEMSKLFGNSVYLTVMEWRPPELAHRPAEFNPGQFWLFLALLALTVLPIALVRWRSFDFNDVGLATVLVLFFALPHRRFIPLFVIPSLPLLGYALSFWVQRLGGAGPDGLLRSPGRRLRRAAIAAGVGCWLLLSLLAPGRLLRLRAAYAGDSLFRVNVYAAFGPDRAIELVRRVAMPAMPGRLFNLYNWGGYLEYFLPAHPTFIDGRAQMVFSDELYLEYLEVHRGGPRWSTILDRYAVGWALVHRERNAILLEAMDAEPGWTRIFEDSESAVVVRHGAESAALLDRFRAGLLPIPETGRTFYLYGLDAERRGEIERAVAAFRRAVELGGREDDARARLAIALADAGRFEEARATAAEAVRRLPDWAPVLLATAEVEARAGDLETALRIFAEAFERWPDRLEAVDGMAAIDGPGTRARIEDQFRRLPRRAWAALALGRVEELDGNLEAARDLYRAEGRDAFELQDPARVSRARQAFERVSARLALVAGSGQTGEEGGGRAEEEDGEGAERQEDPER